MAIYNWFITELNLSVEYDSVTKIIHAVVEQNGKEVEIPISKREHVTFARQLAHWGKHSAGQELEAHSQRSIVSLKSGLDGQSVWLLIQLPLSQWYKAAQPESNRNWQCDVDVCANTEWSSAPVFSCSPQTGQSCYRLAPSRVVQRPWLRRLSEPPTLCRFSFRWYQPLNLSSSAGSRDLPHDVPDTIMSIAQTSHWIG